MNEHENLFDGFDHQMTIQFRAFHAENPFVYEEIRNLALALHKRGRTRYGLMALINVFRWHRAMDTDGDDFKINNNFSPYYARLIMANEPSLNGFFSLRKSVADGADL